MEPDETINQPEEDLFFRYRDEINPAYARAVNEALRRHGQAGKPVAYWEDGRVVVERLEHFGMPSVWDNEEDDVYSELLGEETREGKEA